MAIGSNNPFPSVLILEGSAPSSPSAGNQRVYIDSADHLLKRKNSSGTVTNLEAGSAFAPWLVDIIPMISDPSATTGTWVLGGFSDTSNSYPFVTITGSPPAGTSTASALFNSSAAQNDAISYKVVLSAGTWNATFRARKSTNTGIITLNQDGASQGTVDTYAAAGAYADLTITGWTVSTDGAHTMQIKAATKNASSSGYLIELFGISFRRTA